MSDARGLTDERAALMIDMLGKMLDRFDAIDARIGKLERLLVMVSRFQRETAGRERNAEDSLASMRRDDFQILIRETASLGAGYGMRQSLTDLEHRMLAAARNAAERDLSAVERLQASTERQTTRITSWPSWGLLGAFFMASASGATTAMAIFVQFWGK